MTPDALLKLDLYCRGLRLDDSCLVEEDGGRRVLRTRAGLGSGLELILPGGLWTNVPVAEPFARQSPYVLRRQSGRYLLERDGRPVAFVRLSPRPAWYDATTSTGKPMTRIGTLQGTYLGIYQAKVCEYWTAKPKINCKFCSVGLNLGVDEAGEKSIDEVLEVVRAARDESGITYVDFNTGHYEGDTYLDLLEPYIRRIKQELGLLVGVQTPPHHDLRRYDGLRELGVNRVSFCFEVFDRRIFRELCPGKAAAYGLDRYLEAIRYCAALAGKGPRREPWVTNGEIIAGLEPPASSIAAIDWIASVGAIPTVCVFRPLTGTDLEHLPPPRTEELVPVFRRLYEASMEHRLPIGCAPNVHVSLVLLPEECASLSDRRFRWQRARLAALRLAFGLDFRRRLARLDARRRSAAAGASRREGRREGREAKGEERTMNPETPTVIIATSLTEASDPIVRNGVRIARAAGARIHLVHAYDLTMLYSGAAMGGGAYLPELIEQESAGQLRRLQDQASRLGIQRAELAGLTAREGAPHRVLVETAAAAGASLIVMGAAESWSGLSKLLGSTADRVVRTAPCPVLALRGELELPPRRVLIAVDLSPASGDAMRRGLRVLAALGAGPAGRPRTAVEALYVAETSLLEAVLPTVDPRQVEADAGKELERFIAAHLPEPGWHVRGRVRCAGAADREILGRCAEAAPDLVVLGTHGRSGFERFLIGSVAESVMRHTRGSVLVIPPPAAADAAHAA